MLRWMLCPVLMLQLALPAPVVGECVLAIMPPPASTAESSSQPASATPKPVKICPCTGKPGCNCCGCGDELEETDATAPAMCPSDRVDEPPNNDQGDSTCFRCSCKPPAALAAAGSYLAGLTPTLVSLCAPRTESVPEFNSFLVDISLPIDHRPPKCLF
jgi:hypothetical protein